MILTAFQSIVELNKPSLNWVNIWKTISFKYINVYDRPVLYKYVHEILPTNKRLFNIRSRNDPLCDHCHIEDHNMHKFYECQKVQNCLNLVRRIIVYFCNMYINDLREILTLDLPKINSNVKNTLNIIVGSYISCTWYNRNNLEYLENKLKAKVIRDHNLKMLILKEKAKDIFTEKYCLSDIRIICTI